MSAENNDGDGGIGWIIFILIFGVGNLILYKTTGMFLIPNPDPAEVRHPRQSRWLDEWGRLKGDRPSL